jgi:hypothetical protein
LPAALANLKFFFSFQDYSPYQVTSTFVKTEKYFFIARTFDTRYGDNKRILYFCPGVWSFQSKAKDPFI